MVVQTPYSNLTALVVDDMAAQQTTLRGQLAMLGLARIDVAGNAEDAVRLVRSKVYQLVLCDYNLNHRTDGQQLFEYLRDNKLLRPDCVFFMVTAENGYASVAAATEHKPDAYLLRPITASDIEDRLKTQLEKRHVLAPVNERLAEQNLAAALAECDKLLARKDRWFVQAMQLKAETLMQLGRHEDARNVYQAVLLQRPQLVWAQLGMARAFKAAGDPEQARRVAMDVIASKDGEKTVAAYDIAAEALEALGDTLGAQALLQDAAAVVPSTKRLFRDSRTGEALALIEAALEQFPDNTGVLLQAAQMNCMALRLNGCADNEVTERVRLYLSRLDKLMPGNERVTQMRRYYRDTLAGLQAAAVAA